MNPYEWTYEVPGEGLVIKDGINVSQLHKFLGKLVSEGKGSYAVTLGESDGDTVDIGYINPLSDIEEVVLT